MASRSASIRSAGGGGGVPSAPPPPPPLAHAPLFPPYPAVPLSTFEARVRRFGLLERPLHPSVMLCAESTSDGGVLSFRSPITGELSTFNNALQALASTRSNGADVTIVETLPSLPSFFSADHHLPSSAPRSDSAERVSTAVWIGFSDGSVVCYDSTKESESASVAWGVLPSGASVPQGPVRSVTIEDPAKTTAKTRSVRKPAEGKLNIAVTAIDRGGDGGTYSAHAHGAIYRWAITSELSEPSGMYVLLPMLFVHTPSSMTCLAAGTLCTPSHIHLLASAGRGSVLTVWVLGTASAPGEDGLPKHADLKLPKPAQGGRKQVGATISIEFSSSAEFLWSGHDDGRVLVWNVRFRTCVGNLDLHSSSVTSLSAIGTTMWTVSSAGECVVLDQETRIEMQRFPLFSAASGLGASSTNAVRLQRVAQAEGCIVWGTDSERARAIFVPHVVAASSSSASLRTGEDRRQGLRAAAGQQASSSQALPAARYSHEEEMRHRSVVDFELAERSAQVEEFLLKMAQLLNEKLALSSAAVECGEDRPVNRYARVNDENDEEISRLQEELVLLHERLSTQAKVEERHLAEIALLQAEKEQKQQLELAVATAEALTTSHSTMTEKETVSAAPSAMTIEVYQDLVARLEQENAELNDLVVSLQREAAAARTECELLNENDKRKTNEKPTEESLDEGGASDTRQVPCVATGEELDAMRQELERRAETIHQLTKQLSDMASDMTSQQESFDRTIGAHVNENKQLVQQLTDLVAVLSDRQPISPPSSPGGTAECKPAHDEPGLPSVDHQRSDASQEENNTFTADRVTKLEKELAEATTLITAVEQELQASVDAHAGSTRRISELEEHLISLRGELQEVNDTKLRMEKALTRELESKRALEAEIKRLNGTSGAAARASVTQGQAESLHERLQQQLYDERDQFSSRLSEEEARYQQLEARLKQTTDMLNAERAAAASHDEARHDSETRLTATLEATRRELEDKLFSVEQQLKHREDELCGMQAAHEEELRVAKGLLDEARRRPASWPRITQTELVETRDAEVAAESGVEEELRKAFAKLQEERDAAESQLDELRLIGRDRVASEASVRVEYEERLSQLHKQVKDQSQKLHNLQLVATTNDALRERLVVLEGFERENGELRRRLNIADGESVEIAVTHEEHRALQQENQDLRKQLQIHKHHVTKLLENEIVMEKRLVAALHGDRQPQQQRGAPNPRRPLPEKEDAVSSSAASTNNRGGEKSTGPPPKPQRSISQLLQAIAPTGKQEHDPTDPHHRSQCTWCSGRVQRSLGGSFGIFASPSPSRPRKSSSPAHRISSSSPPLTGTLGGALADDRVPERISRLERARDATTNHRIKSAIVAELLALHKSVLPGDV